jgi:hypothetical protein
VEGSTGFTFAPMIHAMNRSTPSPRDPSKMLLLLLVLNVVASVVHYVDNIARWAVYPEPAWDNARLTDAFWFVMTPVGVLAYVLYRRGKKLPAFALEYLYGAMNLVVLGHYLFAWPWEISLVVNATILAEAATAFWLIGYTASLHWREVPASGELS